ncbi:PAS domain S-box-containing protein/diguanylate cyclase (GGDEF) domain-containing protein [Rhizobiales bacterium GAS113]|nr:PAS domain S-box-containing protein/diguanylate cyclase (GGDEF) domain-containing protein [Rhizobiales bacterium GAS113]
MAESRGDANMTGCLDTGCLDTNSSDTGSAGTACLGSSANADDGRLRVGIRGKLFGAFAGVASLTLIASVVAFFSYDYIGQRLRRIDVEGIPAVDRAFTLARQGAELSAISSSLVAANDQGALAAAIVRLRTKRREIGATLDALDSSTTSRILVESIKRHVDELELSTDRLSESIQQRLGAADDRERLATGAVAAHGALMGRLAPMADDAGFDLASGLQSFDENEDRAALLRLLAKLSNVDAPALLALTDLRGDGNLILGILTEVSLAPNADVLRPLRDRFTASAYSARKAAKDLGEGDKPRELRIALEGLLAFGQPGGGVFEARGNELALTAQGWELATKTQSKTADLAVEIQQFVKIAQDISSGAVTASGSAIRQSQAALLGLMILSIASALLIAWCYVGNGLLRRLDGLNRAMLALAGGNLEVAIPHEGKDEIRRMAVAVEVFKRDAIRRKELEAERERDRIEDLRRREASFRLLFESNPLPMWVYDARTLGLVSVNDAAVTHYGYSREQFLSMSVPDVCPVDNRDSFTEYLQAVSSNRQHQTEETWPQLRADGTRFEATVFSQALTYESHAAALVALIDVTERKRAEACVVHMAHHDALTDLPNRVLFRQRLNEALARMRREDHRVAIHCLDLDHFKSVNDTLGHPVGDALLRAVSERLLSCVRETDTVSRLGGDEFAIVQDAVKTPEEVSLLATRLLDVIGAPYQLQGHEVVVNVSVGIALAPSDGEDPDLLLKNSDMALYRAKGDGRGTYRFFEPEMDARLQSRRVLEVDLRAALQRQQFELYYQPQIDLRTGTILGFEALIRWHHPERGIVPPLDFIPLAEEIGLIAPIGEWVLRQACAEAATWPENIAVAVNLSPVQFANKNLVQSIMLALASTGLRAHRLELEVTESVLLHENDTTLSVLHQLRALGVRIAMDDFGTGYSSLSYLRKFPFDKIKIDRSFVSDMTGDADCAAIIRAVVGLAEGLHMTTTAEGVETQDQLERLRAEGYVEGQGYFFSRPMPVGELREFLQQHGHVVDAALPERPTSELGSLSPKPLSERREEPISEKTWRRGNSSRTSNLA